MDIMSHVSWKPETFIDRVSKIFHIYNSSLRKFCDIGIDIEPRPETFFTRHSEECRVFKSEGYHGIWVVSEYNLGI